MALRSEIAFQPRQGFHLADRRRAEEGHDEVHAVFQVDGLIQLLELLQVAFFLEGEGHLTDVLVGGVLRISLGVMVFCVTLCLVLFTKMLILPSWCFASFTPSFIRITLLRCVDSGQRWA